MERQEMLDKIYEVIKSKIWETLNNENILIWDVLHYYFKEYKLWTFNMYNDTTRELLDVWQDKRKFINEQSDDCIEFVFNLVKDI